MKYSKFQKYKHDTIGKFKTLESLISEIDENELNSSESLEILRACHETFQNMFQSSEKFINDLDKKTEV